MSHPISVKMHALTVVAVMSVFFCLSILGLAQENTKKNPKQKTEPAQATEQKGTAKTSATEAGSESAVGDRSSCRSGTR